MFKTLKFDYANVLNKYWNFVYINTLNIEQWVDHNIIYHAHYKENRVNIKWVFEKPLKTKEKLMENIDIDKLTPKILVLVSCMIHPTYNTSISG